MNRFITQFLIGTIGISALISPVLAKTTADAAWARATVAGQNMGGAYVTLTSDRDAKLIAASSPVAKSMELHTMTMEGERMVMQPVRSIELPANQPVALTGKYHLMFMGLNQPLAEGSTVPVTLKIKLSSGYVESLTLQVPVRSLAHTATH